MHEGVDEGCHLGLLADLRHQVAELAVAIGELTAQVVALAGFVPQCFLRMPSPVPCLQKTSGTFPLIPP